MRQSHHLTTAISRISTILLVCGIYAAILNTGCSGSEKKKGASNSETSSNSDNSEASDDSSGANANQPLFGEAKITGRITVKDAKTNGRKLTMTGDHFCTQFDKQFVPPKDQIGADGGLPHTFVYIKKGITGKYAVPEEPAILDQSSCMYVPHILGLQVNQVLEIRNSDDTAHNVHAQPKRNEKFNIPQPTKGVVSEESFKRPEVMVKFKCDVHGWMNAYVGVVKHPFFTVTDENGNFEIDKLPPGEYTLATWHELYGERDAKVTITADSTETVDIEYARKN